MPMLGWYEMVVEWVYMQWPLARPVHDHDSRECILPQPLNMQDTSSPFGYSVGSSSSNSSVDETSSALGLK